MLNAQLSFSVNVFAHLSKDLLDTHKVSDEVLRTFGVMYGARETHRYTPSVEPCGKLNALLSRGEVTEERVEIMP